MIKKIVLISFFLLLLATTVSLATTTNTSVHFYDSSNKAVSQVNCGSALTLKVDGYTGSSVWLVQTKNGVSNYNSTYTVPNTFTTQCNRDEGKYDNKVFNVVNGQKGPVNLGSASLVVKAIPSDPQVVRNCVAAKIATRENDVKTAFGAFVSSINTALDTRKTELLAAWQISDKAERKTAIQSAWTKFKTTQKAATKTYKQAKDNAWKKFSTDVKTCRTAADPAISTYESPGSELGL